MGDIILAGMAQDDLVKAIRFYQTNPYTNNDELAEIWALEASSYTKSLSSEEIQAKIIGSTMTGFSIRRGVEWTEYYRPDGTITGIYDGGKTLAKWSLSGSKLCWDYSGTKYDGCWPLALNGRQVVFYEKGRIAGRARLLEGNPEGL